ncbi:MAG: RcnB family protein [Sulfitobacter sp.]
MRKHIGSGLMALMMVSAVAPAYAQSHKDRGVQSETVTTVTVDKVKTKHGVQKVKTTQVETTKVKKAKVKTAKVKAVKVKTAKKVQVVQKQSHRFQRGQRISGDQVVVVKDWQRRGLQRPARGQVYVVDRGDLYLATAASMIAQALIN